MYAVLHLPNFELQSRLRDDPSVARNPLALLDESSAAGRRKDRHRIVQLNRAAREAGVESGMTATQGQARCPELHLFTRDIAREQSAREALLFHAANLSPRIEATAPGLCTIDLKGLDERPESLLRLAEHSRESLTCLNLQARVGIASNPDLAALVARCARPVRLLEDKRGQVAAFLNPLPLSILDLNPATLQILHGWGIATLGQLTALPAEEVIRRLGAELIPSHELAGGGRDRPLQLHEPAMDLTEAADIEHPIEKLEALIFVLNRFLEQIAARLETVYLVAESLTLKLKFDDDSVFEREFRIPDPTRDTRILLRSLHTFLESFTAKAAVIGVSLGARPARAAERQLDLFQTSLRDPNQFAETLARLDALLGPDRVGSPVIEPGHRPDAVKIGPFQPDDRPRRGQTTPAADTSPRFGPALRRFRPPLPVRVQVRRNSDREFLIRVDSQELQGHVQESQGPWKQSGDWWDVDTEWAREEWDVQLSHGPLLRLARDNEGWLLDGIYD
ncbi:MAG: DNA polymerase Y family protein [Verrucomicrobiae bacterium]|nr:DNA polymerase Y family protein [Verrucomicrobiae bacterium]